MVKEWLGLASIPTTWWAVDIALEIWWENMSSKNALNRKALVSLTMLVSWAI
jgi:hypothetical protein